MSRPVTLVFVDALAEYYLERYSEELQFVSGLPHRVGIEPGLGFSVNIKAELLGGLTPDEVGFFCKWNYAENPTFRLPAVVRALAAFTDNTQFTARVTHRLLSRVFGADLFTIPLDEIHLYDISRCPEAYDAGFPHPTLLSRWSFERVVHSAKLRSDEHVTARGVARMATAGNLYVSLVEPDAVGHRQGPDSVRMARKLAEVDAQVARLWRAHLAAGRGLFLVFSDHGMSPVTSRPWFDPRQILGRPGRDTYACFSDSTMLRFWVFDDALLARLDEALASIRWGTVLSGEERTRFGVADPRHGHRILLADDGVIPTPSHVGGKHPRAVGMHGYHPDLATQAAVAAWSGGVEGVSGADPDRRIRARDFPDFVENLMSGEE